MKHSVKKATLKLLKNTKIKTIKSLSEEVKKLSGTKWDIKRIETNIEKILAENIEGREYIIKETGEIIKKDELFANTKFYIKQTEKEVNEKMLIIGHRFIPFISETFYPDEIVLLDSKNKALKQKTQKMHFEEAILFFSFFDIEQITYLQEIEGEYLFVSYFDLKQWSKENNFTKHDYIQIQVVNINKKEYKIEKIEGREFNTQTFILEQRDKKLENAILATIREEEIPTTVSRMLFTAYVSFGEEKITETGSPLAQLINKSDVLNLENYTGVPFIVEAGLTVHDKFADMKMPEAGKSKDLNGIFYELGYSFSEDFVIALIIQQLKTKEKIDANEILSVVLRTELGFINEKQAINFDKAFNKVLSKTIKEWENIKIDKFVFKLLEICIDIEKTTNKLLRATDKFLFENPDIIETFDYSMLEPFKPIEMTAEELIHFIIESKAKLPTIDIKKISNQLEDVLKKIKTEVDDIIENYLWVLELN